MIKIFHRTVRDTETSELELPIKGSWISATKPDGADIEVLSKLLDLDTDTLKDALDPYEAPRIAVDEKDVYIFTRYCHPQNKMASTEPLLILFTPSHVVTVSPYDVDFLNNPLKKPSHVTTQKTKLVLELLEQINETYRVYLDEITRTTFKMRTQLNGATLANADFLKFIDLEEDLNEMLTSLQPYSLVLEALFSGKYIPLHSNDQDLIEDLKLSTSELIELTRSRLRTMENMRDVYSAISTNILNATFKRLTSISIFIAIPTLVGGLYGMNVALPFDAQPFVFWYIAGITVFVISLVILIFRRNKWL